jgi:Domain of unknown function (DUF4436)
MRRASTPIALPENCQKPEFGTFSDALMAQAKANGCVVISMEKRLEAFPLRQVTEMAVGRSIWRANPAVSGSGTSRVSQVAAWNGQGEDVLNVSINLRGVAGSIPVNESFTATFTGIKFDGTVTEDETYKLMHTTIEMRRANNVISVSLVVMTVMFVLAVSVMGMVLQLTASPGEVNLVPLTLCVALIFGLPALRNVQPSVPGMGVLSDYISFIWAELMVSVSAITLAWIWIIRSRESRKVSLLRRSTDVR